MGKSSQMLTNGSKVDFESVLDKNGREVSVGDEVDVDEPGSSDMHQHSFRGMVIDVNHEQGYVSVSDQDDDCFDVDGTSVTLIGD